MNTARCDQHFSEFESSWCKTFYHRELKLSFMMVGNLTEWFERYQAWQKQPGVNNRSSKCWCYQTLLVQMLRQGNIMLAIIMSSIELALCTTPLSSTVIDWNIDWSSRIFDENCVLEKLNREKHRNTIKNRKLTEVWFDNTWKLGGRNN